MENQSEEVTTGECGFKFHDFMANIGDSLIAFHLIKMDNCLYIWVGDNAKNTMDDLAFAIASPYEKEPLTTKIMGSISNDISSSLAKRLSKRLSLSVYASFNVQVDNILLPAIEKRLRDEFNSLSDTF